MLKKKLLCVIMIVAMITTQFSFVFAWSSDEDVNVQSTHTILVEQGLNVLFNDLSDVDKNDAEFMAVINKLRDNHMLKFKEGAIAPDFTAQEYMLFQDHFYDPYTKSNFTTRTDLEIGVLDFVHDTAESRSREYVGWAVQYWEAGDYENAAYYLGMAMHFFTDISMPHHASNALGGTREPFTKHSTFESYIDGKKESFLITTTGAKTDSAKYTDVLQNDYIADFMRSEVDSRAKMGYAEYHNNFKADDTSTWDPVATSSMRNAQEGVARVVYRFAKEIVNPNSKCTNVYDSDITLDIRVKTKNGSITDTFYGTDNDVFFGVELTNGRLQEWKLDKSMYNDHENGCDDTYTVTLPKTAGNEIRKAYIRKQRGWEANTVEDNWYPEEIEVTSNDGKCHFYNRVDQWLNGNSGIYFEVAPYTVNKVDLDIRIETKNSGFFGTDGTDSDVYFGAELSNGTKIEWLLDKDYENECDKGDNDHYYQSINMPADGKIAKVWLRKSGIDDDWRPLNMTVTASGQKIFDKVIDAWFTSSTPKMEWTIE